jgi:hypothetical protein
MGTGIASIIHKANTEITKAGEVFTRIGTLSLGFTPSYFNFFAREIDLKFRDLKEIISLSEIIIILLSLI